MERIFIAAAALAGAVSVAADTFAQHMLVGNSVEAGVASIAIRYGFIHAAVLVGVALLARQPGEGLARVALMASGWCFIAGLLLFCGGLYLLAAGIEAFIPLVPVGGTLFIAGWIALFLHAVSPRPLA